MSNFVYSTFITELRHNESYFSSIETFIFNFIFPTNNNYILKDFVIVFPQSIGIISAIKYVILAASMLIALILTYNRYNKSKIFDYSSIVFCSFLFTAVGYILSKLMVGQFPIGIIFFPGLISICLIHRFMRYKKLFNRVSLIVILVILILSSVNYSLYHTNDLINKDETHSKYIESSAYWYFKYSNGEGASDIQTNNLYYMYMSKEFIQKGDTLNPIYDYFWALDPSRNIYPIAQNTSSISNTNIKYYIINKRLNTIAVEKWNILKPWRCFGDVIDKNRNINKIYNSKDINILLNLPQS